MRLANTTGWSIDLPDPDPGPARLGIRPGHLRLAEGSDRDFESEIVVERLGVETYMAVGSLADPVMARVEGDVAIQPDDRVGFSIDPQPATCSTRTAKPSIAPNRTYLETEDNMTIKVTIWNEGRHEQLHPEVQKIYPDRIDGAIAVGLAHEDFEIRLGTLDDPGEGLRDALYGP